MKESMGESQDSLPDSKVDCPIVRAQPSNTDDGAAAKLELGDVCTKSEECKSEACSSPDAGAAYVCINKELCGTLAEIDGKEQLIECMEMNSVRNFAVLITATLMVLISTL